MKLQHIQINDILSIQNIALSFADSGLFLLEGYNFDRGTANGAGKSSIFNSLTWCLYNKMPKDINVDEIIRRGQKTGSVTVTFIDSKGDTYVVTRGRPTKFSVSKNDVVQNITQDELESIIGITYNQFLATTYTAQTGDKKLIKMNDAEKKDFFLNLMKLDDFTVYKKKVDLQLKDLSATMNALVLETTKLETRIEAWKESLVDEQEIELKLSKIETSSIQAKIDELYLIESPDLSKYEQLEKQIEDKLSDIQKKIKNNSILDSKIEYLETAISEMNNTHDPDMQCPHCKEMIYTADSGQLMTPEEARQKRETKIQELQNKKQVLVDQLHDDTELSNKQQQILDLKAKIRLKKNAEQQSYNEASNSIVLLNRELNEKKQQQNILQNSLKNNKKIKQDIAVAAKTLDTLAQKKKELEKKTIILDNLSSMLSMTGAPAYIMETIISQFNEYMNKYLHTLWDGAQYQLLSFKSNKTGDSIAKFSEKFTLDGKECTLGSLSGGEFRTLSLIMDMSVIDLVKDFFHIYVNPTILDEPFSGLDAAGKEWFTQILNDKAKDATIIVIDHESEIKSCFDDIIKIEKRNGITVLG